MERWVPITLAVFLGLAAVIVVVFTAIYSSDAKAERPRGPRLAVFLVPPPPPSPPYRPSNWTEREQPSAPPPAGNASLLSLSNLAAVFPVDSSFPELFLLRPGERLFGRQDAAGSFVMDVPGGLRGVRPAGEGTPTAGAHKIVRGDRRMTFGDVDVPAYTSPNPVASNATPPDSLQRTSSVVPPAPAPATPTTPPARPARTRTPSPVLIKFTAGAGVTQSPSRPLSSPAGTTGTTSHRQGVDVDLCVRAGGSPLFVREEDTRALLEDTLRQVKPAESAVMRKAMKALMEAYQRHMDMEEVSSPRPTSGCVNLPTTRTSPSPPSTSSSRKPGWWEYVPDRRLPQPRVYSRPREAAGVRRDPTDYPADYDNDYNHLDGVFGPRRVAWPLRTS